MLESKQELTNDISIVNSKGWERLRGIFSPLKGKSSGLIKSSFFQQVGKCLQICTINESIKQFYCCNQDSDKGFCSSGQNVQISNICTSCL